MMRLNGSKISLKSYPVQKNGTGMAQKLISFMLAEDINTKQCLEIKAHLHLQIFLAKTSVILLRDTALLLALVILGDMTQIKMIIFVLPHPRWLCK
jgi:hypothetical protein